MVVGVDGRGLRGVQRGVSRVVREVCTRLAAGGDEVRVLLPAGAAAPAGTLAVHDPRGALATAAGALARRPAPDRGLGCEAFWAPAPRPLAPTRAPLVLHVHDRSWEERPGDFSAYERLFHRVADPRRLARRAARVLFDTDVVRREVVAAWGLEPERCALAAPGVDRVDADPAALPALGGPFLLFVGARDPRKGVDVLLEAFARARAAGLARELVLVGAGHEADGGPSEPGVHRLGAVEERALRALYAAADALVLPSRLEGYGLPPLEARAAGTPAVVSDLPELREVLGDDGVRYVPPGDAAALAQALADLPAPPTAAARVPSWDACAAAVRTALADAAAEAA